MADIKIAEIIIGERARVSNGSLETLRRSIESLGLLHPIGITPDKHLIFGGRRLQACKDIGMETIPARVFDIAADDPVTALRMERAENEGRLDLTPSEKVELGMRIEESLAGRQGNPTGANQYSSGITATLPEYQKGESREIAAQAVNMKPTTYRKAKVVVESGNEQAIQAMDSGEKSINAAYKAVREDKPEPEIRTIKITLHNNPETDAGQLLKQGGQDYCTRLAIAILKAAGHEVEI